MIYERIPTNSNCWVELAKNLIPERLKNNETGDKL